MTQLAGIKSHLNKGLTITPLEALALFGTMRLAVAVDNLRKQGMTIHTRIRTAANGSEFAEYYRGREGTPSLIIRNGEVMRRVGPSIEHLDLSEVETRVRAGEAA